MLFNSIQFLWFFAIVFAAYWALARAHRVQLALLLVASYFFYAYWDWRFLGLLVASTAVDFACGILLDRAPPGSPGRKAILGVSLAANLGRLGFFKYFNFFLGSLDALLQAAGLGGVGPGLSIALPVGVSFYTFQTMSYMIDRYRGDLPAERDPLRYAVYVGFFPQIVSGPIVRATDLLPQLRAPRPFSANRLATGVQLVLWGLFKKAVVADQLAPFVNAVFGGGGEAGALLRLGAVYAFAIQIYCDFSGYTDIARGAAKMLGFEYPQNFLRPYFARDPGAFWRRWHISLSTWLRDYLYIPLGGNRGGRHRTYANLMATMVIGGLWHGAAWHFVLWGAFHGLLLVVHRRWRDGSAGSGAKERSWPRAVAEGFVFFQLVCLGWLFFRADSLSQILWFLTSSRGGLYGGVVLGNVLLQGLAIGTAGAIAVLAWDAVQERQAGAAGTGPAIETPLDRAPIWSKVAVCMALYAAITLYGRFVQDAFIYFQF